MTDINPRTLWLPGIIALALLAIVGVRIWAPKPSIPPGVPIVELGAIREGGEWNAPGNRVFASELVVEFDQARTFRSIDLSLDNNDTYRLEIATERGFLPFHSIEPVVGYGLARREIQFDPPVGPTTHLRIVAVSGDGMYSLGHLIIQ